VPPAEHEDEDLFGERLVSSEWLERRAKRSRSRSRRSSSALEARRREDQLDEREARFEADMYLREDEIEAREGTCGTSRPGWARRSPTSALSSPVFRAASSQTPAEPERPPGLH
jgi:hypothetical protein